jgi:AraC-like DNA-binding protein
MESLHPDDSIRRAHIDPLSAICSALNVKCEDQGALYLPNSSSWGMRCPGEPGVSFGACLSNSYWLAVESVDTPIHIREGDCYLIKNHLSYCMSSSPETKATDCDTVLKRGDAAVSRPIDPIPLHGKEHKKAKIGARFVFDQGKTGPLFDLLPPTLHFRADSETAHILRSMLNVLSHEAVAPKLGATMMTDHLARILFVQALRTYVASDEHPAGWLSALHDEKIGAALALMHRDIARRWTVDDLAAAVGMSRSSFALRFKTLVGLAPLDYWLQWRMRLAGQLLRNTKKTVASVALAWGYESERSFGKAFKRVMGGAPTWYRKTSR